jgi:invasion protein IalB
MTTSHNRRLGGARRRESFSGIWSITGAGGGVLALLIVIGTADAAPAQTVDLVSTEGSWSLYADKATPKHVCFIAAQPQSAEPKGANRGPIYFYISAWPKDGIKTEPSIKVGYAIAAGKDMTVTIGADTFKLFPKGDRAFVSDPTEELKLIEAMKVGETAVVQATSARGTSTTDTYALTGIAGALQKLAETCP